MYRVSLLIGQRRLNNADPLELLGLICLALIFFLQLSFPFSHVELLNDSLCILNLEAFFQNLFIYLAEVLSSLLLFLYFPL